MLRKYSPDLTVFLLEADTHTERERERNYFSGNIALPWKSTLLFLDAGSW